MKRPESKELDTIFSTVDEIRAAEEHLKNLKARVATEARALSQIANKSARIDAAIYAYWFAPEVNASDIAFGATGLTHPGKLLKLAGPVSVGVSCDRCQEDLAIRSRAQMKDTLDRLRGGFHWPEGYRVLCPNCEVEIHEQRAIDHEEFDRQQERRRRELSNMPYCKYVQTTDWREIREAHLRHLMHEFGDVTCETCNSNQNLGAYHKTLAGLGGRDDIVLLCTTCRDGLLSAGRLAGEPGDGNRLSEAHLDQLAAALRDEEGF